MSLSKLWTEIGITFTFRYIKGIHKWWHRWFSRWRDDFCSPLLTGICHCSYCLNGNLWAKEHGITRDSKCTGFNLVSRNGSKQQKQNIVIISSLILLQKDTDLFVEISMCRVNRSVDQTLPCDCFSLEIGPFKFRLPAFLLLSLWLPLLLCCLKTHWY